jgi:hypothetical protein
VDNGTPDIPERNTRHAAEKKNKYVFTDGLLWINLRDHTTVVIPCEKIQNVILTYYDHVLANHPGWKETYWAIKQRFYWKGQKNDIRLYVKSCQICACTKPVNVRADDPMTARTPYHDATPGKLSA